MRTFNTIVAVVLTAVFFLAAPAVAASVRGQVLSITITECGLKPGSCEGNIILWSEAGKKLALHVTPESKLTREGKPIFLGEVGVGNMVSISDFEPLTQGSGRIRSLQSP